MRKKLFKIHSWLAITCFMPLLVICVTGGLLVFKVEIDTLLMKDKMVLVDTVENRINMDELAKHINSDLPDYEIGSWEIFDNQYRADAVYLLKRYTQDWYKIYLNPYTNEILSAPVKTDSDLTDWMVELHYSFLLHGSGIFIVFIFGVVLVILGITGLIIYRKFYTRLFTLRYKAVKLVLFSDIHKMFGTFASPILLVIGITGVYWNAKEFLHEVSHTAEEETWVLTKRLYSNDISLDKILSDSQSGLIGFTPTYLLFPFDATSHFTVFGHVTTRNPLYSEYNSWLSFDKHNGQLLSVDDIRQGSLLRKFDDSIRRLHFGSFAGIVPKILWCIAGLTPLALVITGGYMWWNRKKKYGKRRT
ncbi:PepSY-associated TM helix domain-containing protein [Paraglaciecola sp.]|uniref:PepSY-associated TM helix domain-containing protein n=1 Tax=Paraglaciecola sp. TaxID=1920173 RepID=UPI0030F44E4A